MTDETSKPKSGEKKPDPTPKGQTPPAPDFDIWSGDLLNAWAAGATDEQRTAAIDYETAHQNRPDVLAALGVTPAPPAE
jgi:hypothetical protein